MSPQNWIQVSSRDCPSILVCFACLVLHSRLRHWLLPHLLRLCSTTNAPLPKDSLKNSQEVVLEEAVAMQDWSDDGGSEVFVWVDHFLIESNDEASTISLFALRSCHKLHLGTWMMLLMSPHALAIEDIAGDTGQNWCEMAWPKVWMVLVCYRQCYSLSSQSWEMMWRSCYRWLSLYQSHQAWYDTGHDSSSWSIQIGVQWQRHSLLH